MSVTVSVEPNWPAGLYLSWETRSVFTNPWTASSHPPQVRLGIWDFSSDPGLVYGRPCERILSRSPATRRPMILALMAIIKGARLSSTSRTGTVRIIGTK